MSKQEHVQTIISYLGDGFLQIPANTPESFEFNGTNLGDYRKWVESLRLGLEALYQSNYLYVIPEGILSQIRNSLEQIRSSLSAINPQNITDAQNNFNNAVSQTETLLSQIAPFLNLADINNYKDLQNKAQNLIEDTNKKIEELGKRNRKLSGSIQSINVKAENLLGKVDSGVLNKELEDLSKSKWHISVLIISILVAAVALWVLIDRSQDYINQIIKYVTSPNSKINWSVYIAKWLASLPYIIVLIFALVEARRRISLIDQFIFRSKIAKSLEGYRLLLLNDLDNYSNKERDQARLQVSQFMITAILELINQPSGKERSSIALRFKDLFEVKADNE